jgi:hypothetical protein
VVNFDVYPKSGTVAKEVGHEEIQTTLRYYNRIESLDEGFSGSVHF